MVAEEVYGYCKFSETCRKRHISEKCHNKHCDVRRCSLRHPKICRYFRDIGFCIFGDYCCFVHKVSSDEKVREIFDKLEKMEKKYTDLEKQLVEKDNENRNLGV